MEELIKKFLYGYGSGYGYGDGSGDGYGSGDGDGDGFGYGDGYGDGSGDGYGSGDGDGDGYGYGYGDGYGDGSGDGSGYGYGSGDGSGYGYGSGDGSGYGYGSGDGIRLTSYKGNRVYYVDDIPCYFLSVNKNLLFAKVMVININDFHAAPQFIFKFNDCFAHGETLQDAKRDAESKYYSQMDVSERIQTFNSTFKRGVQYEARKFYDWHSTLTGSCQSGKALFIKQNNIDLDSKMTVDEFIQITQNAYGGEVIRQLNN